MSTAVQLDVCLHESLPQRFCVASFSDVMDRLGDSWLEHISKVAHAGSLTISVPIDKVRMKTETCFNDFILRMISTYYSRINRLIGNTHLHLTWQLTVSASSSFARFWINHNTWVKSLQCPSSFTYPSSLLPTPTPTHVSLPHPLLPTPPSFPIPSKISTHCNGVLFSYHISFNSKSFNSITNSFNSWSCDETRQW